MNAARGAVMGLLWCGCVASTGAPESPDAGGTTQASSGPSVSSSMTGGSSLSAAASSGSAMSSSAAPTPAQWDIRTTLPTPRQETAVVALGQQVLVLGGFDDGPTGQASVLAYDVAADRWSESVPLPRPLHHINATVVDGTVWVLGALEGLGFVAVGAVLSWRPGDAQWQSHTPMPAGTQRGASVVGVVGREVWVVGGLRAGSSVADAHAFHVDEDRWDALPPLPVARDHMAGGVVAGRLVVAGGRNGALDGRVDALDVTTRTWSRLADLPTPRAGTMGAVWDGRLFVMGGEGNAARPDGMFSQVEVLDVAAGTWSALPEMMPAIHGTGAVAVDGVIHVPGGATRAGFGAVARHAVLRVVP